MDSDEGIGAGQVNAVDRLVVKLAMKRVAVRRYTRVVKGQRQDVNSYQYNRKGAVPGIAPGIPDATKEMGEASRVREQLKKVATPGAKPAAKKDAQLAPSGGAKVASTGGGKGAVEALEKKVGPQGSGTRDDPIVTSDVNEAAKALGEGRYVRLKHKREVSTLLDKLAEYVADAKAKGEKAPSYDLCRVSVENTNLFCVESKGIPRVKMPQFSGVPEPGSRADRLEKNQKGEVDVGGAFVKYLQDRGVLVKPQSVSAQYLKASQNELNGEKIVSIAGLMEQGKIETSGGAAIFVSNDDYVVDGHHRWAAVVAREIDTGTDIEMPTQQIQMDIISLLALANRWTKEMGMRPQSVADTGRAA